MNKRKVINDPVYGFIPIQSPSILELVEQPLFQRLRRIKQLGMTHLVYPGAVHTRFAHALGAHHLMNLAIKVLQSKGVEVSSEEAEAAAMAILLHDLGHGPFSHALEEAIIPDLPHESVSLLLMEHLNKKMDGRLDMAIAIFKGKYEKHFLHDLVSSQLDVDRLDYLSRDSFFTGVSEGTVGWDRLLQMMTVADGRLVIEEKGIYSVEQFLVARRLMYWQVYLHKAAIAAETLLSKILSRARLLRSEDMNMSVSKALDYFLRQQPNAQEFRESEEAILTFGEMDDDDVSLSVRHWQNHPDRVLSRLSKQLFERNLPLVILQHQPFSQELVSKIEEWCVSHFGISESELPFFVETGEIDNSTYKADRNPIRLLKRNQTLIGVEELAQQINMGYLTQQEKKYYLYCPKEARNVINIAN